MDGFAWHARRQAGRSVQRTALGSIPQLGRFGEAGARGGRQSVSTIESLPGRRSGRQRRQDGGRDAGWRPAERELAAVERGVKIQLRVQGEALGAAGCQATCARSHIKDEGTPTRTKRQALGTLEEQDPSSNVLAGAFPEGTGSSIRPIWRQTGRPTRPGVRPPVSR